LRQSFWTCLYSLCSKWPQQVAHSQIFVEFVKVCGLCAAHRRINCALDWRHVSAAVQQYCRRQLHNENTFQLVMDTHNTCLVFIQPDSWQYNSDLSLIALFWARNFDVCEMHARLWLHVMQTICKKCCFVFLHVIACSNHLQKCSKLKIHPGNVLFYTQLQPQTHAQWTIENNRVLASSLTHVINRILTIMEFTNLGQTY